MAAKAVKLLGFQEVIDAARYLGWHTHNQEGVLDRDAQEVARRLAGKVTESVMLGTLIGAEFDRVRAERAASLAHIGAGI